MVEVNNVEKLPEHPRLGRTIVNLDARSKEFLARGLLFKAAAPPKNKTWRRPAAYDQGQSSRCVEYSNIGMLNSQPLSKQIPLKKRRALPLNGPLYPWAQDNDEWPGREPDYYGTSVLAGVKGLANFGMIQSFRWGLGTDDTLQMLSQHGPVVIGISWHNDMFTPDLDGFIKPGGGLAGGHAIELHGVNWTDEYVLGTNSWGPFWGVRGRFKIRFDVLRALLKDDGECVTFDLVNPPVPTATILETK